MYVQYVSLKDVHTHSISTILAQSDIYACVNGT